MWWSLMVDFSLHCLSGCLRVPGASLSHSFERYICLSSIESGMFLDVSGIHKPEKLL